MKTWLAFAALTVTVLLALRLEIFDIHMARSINQPLPTPPSWAPRQAIRVRAQGSPQELVSCLALFDALERSTRVADDAIMAETACFDADAVPAGPCRDFMRAAREAAYRATNLDDMGVPWAGTSYAAARREAGLARSKCRDASTPSQTHRRSIR